jgi:hypothetical protein
MFEEEEDLIDEQDGEDDANEEDELEDGQDEQNEEEQMDYYM